MPKETKEDKAKRYLVEGHVDIQHAGPDMRPYVLAHVYSDSGGDPYIVQCTATGWSCDCPAQIDVCSHVLALLLVFPSDVKDERRGVGLYSGEDEFSSLLDG